MKRRLFNAAALVSLLLCLALVAFWVRSLRHFEMVTIRSTRWPQADEVREVYLGFSWYSNTLRLELIRRQLLPVYFWTQPQGWTNQLRANQPPGLFWNMVGQDATRFMNGYSPGFAANHSSYGIGPNDPGERWVLAVRPWLPTLLTAVLPALWLYRFRHARRARAGSLCPTCGYDLRGTPSGPCPECGAAREAKAHMKRRLFNAGALVSRQATP